MKNPHDIIRRPVLTEKAYAGIADKRYVFEVDIHANKTEIKQAIEAAFAEDGVKVEKVNTLRTIGKIKRQAAPLAAPPKSRRHTSR
jgi:large subunit ribosomal protein L23